MHTEMSQKEIKSIIVSELPGIIKEDPKIRRYVLDITKRRYADKDKTEDRIEMILDEMKRDREENARKWEENQKVIKGMLASIEALSKKHDSSIGALGARWGLRFEGAFRNGLRGILEDSFGVKVERYQDFDTEGRVFGRPDQVEMDVIIHNGTLILCEMKSSISWEEMYVFWRKKEFYEDRHGRKADRVMVISPMVDERAKKVAQGLGIEVFGYAEDVDLSVAGS